MNKGAPWVEFNFAIKQKDGYDEIDLLGVEYRHDVVPAGENPVAYLRRRVIEELDRRTLAGTSAPTSQQLVVLPGFEVKKEEEVP